MRLLLGAFALALATLPAHGEGGLSPKAVHVLTPIDAMPTRDAVVGVLANPLDQLSELALAPTSTDVGVRLRAIRALPYFCAAPCGSDDPGADDDAHAALVAVLAALGAPASGSDALLLRAAIEALGEMRSHLASDVARLAPHLDHPSRDLRAAAASALRAICHVDAIPVLRARNQIEAVPQVRLAISSALRDLATCR